MNRGLPLKDFKLDNKAGNMQNNTRENNIRCTYKRWGGIADSWFALEQAISKLKSIYQVASGLNSSFYGVRVGSCFRWETPF